MSIGSFVVLVLVRRIAPREPSRIARAKRFEQRDAGFDRPERRAIEHVDLAAAAARRARACGTSARRRRDGRCTPGSSSAVHRLREPLGDDPRRADELERPRRAAAFRDVRAFEEHRARIDDRACRASACSATAAPTAARSRRNTSRAASPSIATTSRSAPIPNCSLKSRASSPMVMPCRIGIGYMPDERLEAAARASALRPSMPPIGFGPVADDHLHAVALGGAQAVRHRVDVGVDAGADVLQIDHEDVEAAQHLGASARASRCRANTPARGARRRRVPASRSCCPARRSGSRAAGRRSPRAGRRGCAARRSATCRSSPSTEAGLQTMPTPLAVESARIEKPFDPRRTRMAPIITHAPESEPSRPFPSKSGPCLPVGGSVGRLRRFWWSALPASPAPRADRAFLTRSLLNVNA